MTAKVSSFKLRIGRQRLSRGIIILSPNVIIVYATTTAHICKTHERDGTPKEEAKAEKIT